MKIIVKLDEKGRVLLPARVRKMLDIKVRQPVTLEVRNGAVYLTGNNQVDESADRVLTDIIKKPGHSRIILTSQSLDKMKREAWEY